MVTENAKTVDVVWTRTHSFIQFSDRRAGKLLHVVCRKPHLFLPSVVASPPKESVPVHRSGSTRDGDPHANRK